MNRRAFLRLAGAGAPAVALAETVVSARQAPSPATSGIVAPTTSPKAKMSLGTQHGDSEETLSAALDTAPCASHAAGANESEKVATTIIQSPLGVSGSFDPS